MDEVVLVDENDVEFGTMEKMEAHRKGALHRAFSIFIFNSKGELLLQKRASSKYHSGGLWTNTCCSHPLPNEDPIAAANRKLKQEMGFTADLTFSHKFIYEAALDNNLIEHELDYVFTGNSDLSPIMNPEEVEAWKYMRVEDIRNDLKENPDYYTAWFKIIMDQPELEFVPH